MSSRCTCGAVIEFVEWTNGAADAVGGEGWVDSNGGTMCPPDPVEWWDRPDHRPVEVSA